MKKTTHSLLSLLLTLSLIFSMIGFMPITAQAAGVTDLTIDGVSVGSSDIFDTGWDWNSTTQTLTLGENGGYNATDPIIITCDSPNDIVKLVLTGPVSIDTSGGSGIAIECTGKLVISSSGGTLAITSNNDPAMSAASIEIKSGTVAAIASTSPVINCAVAISGGKLSVVGGTVNGDITMTGGSVMIKEIDDTPTIALQQGTGGSATLTIRAGSTTRSNDIFLNATPSSGYKFNKWTMNVTVADLEFENSGSAQTKLQAADSDPSFYGVVTITPTYTPPSSSSSSSSSGGSSGSGNSSNSQVREPIPVLTFSWDGIDTLTVKGDGISVASLENVWWGNNTTTEFVARNGSVIIKFNKSFLSKQKPGDHRIRVEFMNISGETTVKLRSAPPEIADDPKETSFNPGTGR